MNSPIQAAPVMRGQARAYQVQSLTQQGCNPFVLPSAARLLALAGSERPHASHASVQPMIPAKIVSNR